jgi:hypothetical protein
MMAQTATCVVTIAISLRAEAEIAVLFLVIDNLKGRLLLSPAEMDSCG